MYFLPFYRDSLTREIIYLMPIEVFKYCTSITSADVFMGTVCTSSTNVLQISIFTNIPMSPVLISCLGIREIFLIKLPITRDLIIVFP
jgi:hypothetical protein